MNYNTPIIFCFVMIVISTIMFLYINGIIKMPEPKTENFFIDDIMKELRSLPDIEIEKLKIDLKSIFEKPY